MPRLTAEEVQARYAEEIDLLQRRTERVDASNLRRIRAQYRSLLAATRRTLRGEYQLTQATSQQVLQSIARNIDAHNVRILGVMRDGIDQRTELANAMAELYTGRFAPAATSPLIAADATLVDLTMQFSADLIGLRTGGIGAGLLRRINTQLRLANVGGISRSRALREVSRAIGDASDHAWRAERIYRTEIGRMQSITTQQSIDRLNALTPTGKGWRWSRIERQEHADVNGQVVPAGGRFRVRVPGTRNRPGRVVLMRYPRDPGAPAVATINCGCWIYPAPLTQTLRALEAA